MPVEILGPVLTVAGACITVILEIKAHIHAAKLNRDDFIFFNGLTTTLQGILLEITDSASRGSGFPNDVSPLERAINELHSTLVGIRITSKKAAERNALLRVLFSKEVRDSLQGGFNQLQACLSSLQLAFLQATGRQLGGQMGKLADLIKQLEQHHVERFDQLERQAEEITRRLEAMDINKNRLVSTLQYSSAASSGSTRPHAGASSSSSIQQSSWQSPFIDTDVGQTEKLVEAVQGLSSCDVDCQEEYLLQIAQALEILPPPPCNLSDVTPSWDQDQQRQQQQEQNQLIREQLQCPICLTIMTDAVTTNTGHNFCAGCINHWRQRSNSCPVTRQPLGTGEFAPNYQLRKVVELFREDTTATAASSSNSRSFNGRGQASANARPSAPVPIPAHPSLPPALAPELERQLRQLQQDVQSTDPAVVIRAANALLEMLQQLPQQLPLLQQHHLQQQERVSRVLQMVAPCFSTSDALHPQVALHLLRHQQLVPCLKSCMWGGSEQAAGNAVALIAHLLNSDRKILAYVGHFPISSGVTSLVAESAHGSFCMAVSGLMGPGPEPEAERIGLLLLRLLRSDNPVVCWQAAEALAAMVDCPGTAEYCKAGLRRLMHDRGLSEQQLVQGPFGRLLEVLGLYCDTRPMVAAAAGLAVLGICQPGFFPDGMMRALVVSDYCSSSSGGVMGLGEALVRLLGSSDDLVRQRASYVIEALCEEVSWEPELWVETCRALRLLLQSSCSRTRLVKLRTLRLMIRNQHLGRPDCKQQVLDACFEVLQAIIGQLRGARNDQALDDDVKLGVQLLADLVQLHLASDAGGVLQHMHEECSAITPLLQSLREACPACEAQRAAEQTLQLWGLLGSPS